MDNFNLHLVNINVAVLSHVWQVQICTCENSNNNEWLLPRTLAVLFQVKYKWIIYKQSRCINCLDTET
jgi:hypothetical protein